MEQPHAKYVIFVPRVTTYCQIANKIQVGMGFQWVNDSQKYHDLPKPIDWYEGMTVFTTSVTHQIHCLVCSAPSPLPLVTHP